MALNPLGIRVTTTRHGEAHVSYRDEATGEIVGFDLSEHQSKCLARVIHRTPTKGLEAVAALLEQAAGQIHTFNESKLRKGPKVRSQVFGQIEAAEDYGSLNTDPRFVPVNESD